MLIDRLYMKLPLRPASNMRFQSQHFAGRWKRQVSHIAWDDDSLAWGSEIYPILVK